VVEYARELGFPPAPDYEAAERIFGDIPIDMAEPAFVFGRNGKPLYLAGPGEPPHVTHARMEQLRARLGPDGFDYMVPA
jgi:hypothetical protein